MYKRQLIIGLMGAKEIDVPAQVGKLPLVLLNATAPTPATSVLPAEFEAGRTVVHHLADRGHTRIALLGDHPDIRTLPRVSATVGHRFAGIEDAVRERGIELARVVNRRRWEPEDGYSAASEFFADRGGVTAVIAANDRMAMGIYQAAQELGVRIGEDLSVISFDDEVIAGYLRPGLTSARLPYEEMGRRATELALAPERAVGEYLLTMPLQVRDSVAQLTSVVQASR